MAIVFTSPKRRRRIFFRIIIISLIFLLFMIFLTIFPPQLKDETQDVSPKGVSDSSSIKINFDVVDSSQFKNLDLFSDVQIKFNYVASDQNGRQVIGSILAVNKDSAKIILEETGLNVSILEESDIGRNEPFAPYY